MIEITLPDGSIKSVEAGTTALDIATGISEGLARNVLAAEVAGEVVDPQRPINESSTLKLLTWNDEEGKSTMWHSSAHLMAEALESMFDGIKFWVGPPPAKLRGASVEWNLEAILGPNTEIQTF